MRLAARVYLRACAAASPGNSGIEPSGWPKHAVRAAQAQNPPSRRWSKHGELAITGRRQCTGGHSSALGNSGKE
jgi:hypothetical protein